MIDVLYVGPYRQNDEWGYTSKAVATLLAAQDINLVLRPVWFTPETQAQDVEHIEEYEYNALSTRDILIQHGLPSYINYNGDFKTNIAILSVDSRIDNTEWITHLRLMDKIIVFSHSEAKLLSDSGLDSAKIFAFEFPPFFLTSKTSDLNLDLKGTIFYTAGSLDIKSGLTEILTAYLSAFSIADPVHLIVCTNQSEAVQEKVGEIKKQLSIYSVSEYYPNIVVVGTTATEVINHVHQIGDFFIDVSYNAIPNQDLLRAVVADSIPILPDNIDIKVDYLAVKTYDDLCVYPARPVADLWSGEFTWTKPNISHLKYKMQQAISTEINLEEIHQSLRSFQETLFTKPSERMKVILCTN